MQAEKKKDLNDILIEKKDGKLFIHRQCDLVQLRSCVQFIATPWTAQVCVQ